MNSQRINAVSSRVVLLLSVIALVTVLIGYTHPLPLPTDEETGAHIFQLSIVALVPLVLLFLGTADWKQPWRSVRPLTIPAAVLVLAFGALYYLEHFR